MSENEPREGENPVSLPIEEPGVSAPKADEPSAVDVAPSAEPSVEHVEARGPSEGEPTDAAAPSAEPSAEHAEARGSSEGEPTDSADDAGEGGDEEGAETVSSEGGPAGKKKRRRRRKKKKGEGVGTSEGSAGAPHAHAHAKHAWVAPLGRYFDPSAPKRHAFSAGEIVAGRVERVTEDAFFVDLFGKATAVVDLHEPREVPVIVEAPAPAEGAPVESAEATPPAAPHLETLPGVGPFDQAMEDAEAARAFAEAEEEDSASETVSSSGEVAAEGAEHEAAPEAHAEEEHDVEEAPAEAPLEPPPPAPELGTIFRGRVGSVTESGHIVIVNRIVDRAAAKERLRAARDARRRIRGLVYGFNRGGFDVLAEGIRVFCPASGMSLGPIDDPTAFIGQKLEFTVPITKGSSKSIVVSRRTILEREARRTARERMKALEIGQRVHGRVAQVREFGLVVDIGDGVEGLVHQSEVAWTRGVRPADVARPGDELEVEVLRVQPATRKDRHGKLSLSLRKCLPDPWDLHADVVKEGYAGKGKVVGLTEFGAFLELAAGIEGLLHISELGSREITHAKQVAQMGDEIDIVVERVDRGQRRLSLSKLSSLEAQAIASGELDPSKAPRNLRPGSHVVVVIEKVEHHGITVQVQGVLGRRGRGYLPNRELGELQGDRRRALSQGSTLDVKIVGIERDGSLKCSVRGRQQDEERRAVQEYRKEAAKAGFGTFGDLLRAKLGDGSGGKGG